jgi:hypothetical protein
MGKCEGCGKDIPESRGNRPRKWHNDACRMRAQRARVVSELMSHANRNRSLVGAVEALVESALDPTSESDMALGALAVELARQVTAGSPTAAAQLRQILVDMKLSSDPSFDPPVTEAQAFRVLSLWFDVRMADRVDVEVGDWDANGQRLDRQPFPPGYRSTAEDGELFLWLGHRRAELVEANNTGDLDILDRWCGANAGELATMRIAQQRDLASWGSFPIAEIPSDNGVN